MRHKRLKVLSLLMVFAASIVTPVIVEAQDYEVDLSDSTATQISGITERLTTKDALESQWTQAQRRQAAYQAELARLEAQQNEFRPRRLLVSGCRGTGLDPQRNMSQTDSVVSRTRDRLGKLYQQLANDRKTVESSKDPALKQELGTLIGVAGTTAVPIWARPTVQGVAGSIGPGRTPGEPCDGQCPHPRYNDWAASAGNRAAANEAALGNIKPGVWVPQSNGGNGAG